MERRRREQAEANGMANDNSTERAPETKIEVTPEMIEAGLQARSCWDSRFEEAEGLVIEVYEAMERARQLKA
jgi:hypothetical protein